jgi:hypothetical protein
MPNTVEDFLKMFSSGEMVDDEQAAQLHNRFVSTRPEDSQFDNRAYHDAAAQYIGNLPDDQFHHAAQSAVRQAPPQQRQDLLGGLLGALKGGNAGGLGAIASMLGLSTTDPKQMSSDDAAKMMNYARKENPEALRQTVEEKPWFVKALGNPVVMGALTMAAARLLSNRGKTMA